MYRIISAKAILSPSRPVVEKATNDSGHSVFRVSPESYTAADPPLRFPRQGIIVRESALAGDRITAGYLCDLYERRPVKHDAKGRPSGGVPLDVRGAAYIVAVSRVPGCALGACPA